MKAASDAGAMVVVAAGNENWDTGMNGSYPDNYAGSFSVGASTDTDAKASYSNRGTITIDVAAPGDKIHSTLPRGAYGSMSGTSMAAPVVAGVAALVKARYPQLTMKEVENRIFRSVQRDGNAAAWNNLVASGGRVDAAAALTPLAAPGAPTPAAKSLTAGAPVNVGWDADLLDGQKFNVEVSRNPDAASTVNETFEAALTRKFTSTGDAPWRLTDGAGANGTRAMATNGLKSGGISQLELAETLPGPTDVSFMYKTTTGGELSFFVDRDFSSLRPRTPSGSSSRQRFLLVSTR